MSSEAAVSRPIGKLKVSLRQGDITDETVDAIVNAANTRFWMGSGVAGAIKRRGGVEIETEAMNHGPAEPGAAVATTAGRLAARYCIHAAVMGDDLVTCGDFIRRATRNALELAEKLGVRSIALPALGTGVGCFPAADCARLMLDTVVEFSRSHEQPADIRFVLFDEPTFTAFANELATRSQHHS